MLSIRFQDPIVLSVVEVIVIDYQTEIVSIPYIDINPYTPNLEESAYFAWADEFDFLIIFKIRNGSKFVNKLATIFVIYEP